MDQNNTDRIALKLIAVLYKKGLLELSLLEQANVRYAEKVKDADFKSAS